MKILPTSLRWLFPVLFAVPALAQWSSISTVPGGEIHAGGLMLTHKGAATGIRVYSALSQTWSTLSPASTAYYYTWGDSFVIAAEPGNVKRAWSARRNASATLVTTSSNATTSYGELELINDPALGAHGTIYAYSAFTNTWSSLALPEPFLSFYAGRTAGVVTTATHCFGFSAFTPEWTQLDVVSGGGALYAGDDCVFVDLRGTGAGPLRYAGYSAVRRTWSVSPLYPSSGAGFAKAAHVGALKAEIDATHYSYAAYSASTGTWATSPLIHSNPANVVISKNVVRVLDNFDPSVAVDVFGAGNGVWQSLTGPNLQDQGVHEDFAYVQDSVTGRLYAASGLVGGGWTSVTSSLAPVYGSTYPSTIHAGLAAAFGLTGGELWGYAPAQNAFVGPLFVPPGTGTTIAQGYTNVGYFKLGSAGIGSFAQGFGARFGNWIAGPAMNAGNPYQFGFGGSMSLLAVYNDASPSDYAWSFFDDHKNAWLPPHVIQKSYQQNAGQTCWIGLPAAGGGLAHAYSAQRGDWTTQSGIGAIVTGNGYVQFQENLAWLTDSNNKLWVYSACERVQPWFQWPLDAQYASSGVGAGGTAPRIGFSVRGQPATELALLYASFQLPPAPLAVPGLGGLLDLDPASAFLLWNLGVFDADGVRELAFPVASPFAAGAQAWVQPVIVDLIALQASFAGRAVSTRFY